MREDLFPAACREFVIPADSRYPEGPTGFRVTHGMTGRSGRGFPAPAAGEPSEQPWNDLPSGKVEPASRALLSAPAARIAPSDESPSTSLFSRENQRWSSTATGIAAPPPVEKSKTRIISSLGNPPALPGDSQIMRSA